MPRITHVITGVGVGGAEMALAKVAAGMDPRFTHCVVSLSDEMGLVPRFQDAGIEVVSLRVPPRLASVPRALRTLASHISRSQPDIVQTWLYHADLLGGVAARWLNKPVVWNVQSGVLDPSGIRRRTIAVARLCGIASRWIPRAIVSCSRSGVDLHAGLGYTRGKFRVIVNGVDTEAFRPDSKLREEMRARLKLSGHPIIGMVARLHPQKDHRTFLSAMRKVVDSHPNTRFVLAGDGLVATNPVVNAMLRESGLHDYVSLLGVQRDIPALLNAFDVFVLSSAFGEGFPNVLPEAMASGVPCVTTDVGDAARIVEGAGRSVPRRDAEAIASACRQILDLPRAEVDAVGRHARDLAIERFSLHASIGQYEQLYDEILSRWSGLS